jgi:hypothetical protein
MDDQTGAPRHLIRGRNAVPFPVGRKGGVQLGDLTGLLAKIRPAVEATHYTGERSAKNYAFVDAVARKNVSLTIANIREKSPVLRDPESSGSIKIAGSMYNWKRESLSSSTSSGRKACMGCWTCALIVFFERDPTTASDLSPDCHRRSRIKMSGNRVSLITATADVALCC